MLYVMLLSAVVCSSGCATVATGKYQSVMVTSEPPGVKVRSDTGESIVTPGTFNLLRNQNHVLVAEREGCEPQQRTLKHGVQRWFYGNILIGVIPGVVDLATGSASKLIPDKVHFDFSQAGQKVAQRQQEYLKAHSDVKPEVQIAIENQAVLKGMTKEQLIASLGIPDQIAQDGGYDKFTYNSRTPKFYLFKDGTLEKTE
jgi:hypothetical protein